MPLDTDPNSRLFDTETLIVNEEEVYGRWNMPEFLSRELNDNEYTVMTVTSELEGVPHVIAQREYGSSQLDWVLIAANNARQVFNWPRAGDVIKIPLAGIVLSEVT
jgi:hypothetical protein